MQENEKPFRKLPIGETIVVFILTTASYWFVFRYECAYVGKFGVPVELLDITINSILSTFYHISGIALTIFIIANSLAMNWPKHPVMQGKLIRIGMILLYPLWRCLNYGIRKQDWGYYLFPIGFAIVFEFLWPMIIHRRKGKTFLERVIADEESEESGRQRTLFGRIFNVFGPYYYLAFMILWMGTGLARTSGEGAAEMQIIFPISKIDSTLILVKAYSEKYVCVRIDYLDKSIKSFVVLEPQSLEFCEKEIGPLKFSAPLNKK